MLSRIAQKHHLLLIADSTLTPPNVFEAEQFGVNIEVVSATKYISGGATAFGGAIIDYGNFDWNLNIHLSEYVEKFNQYHFPPKNLQSPNIVCRHLKFLQQ